MKMLRGVSRRHITCRRLQRCVCLVCFLLVLNSCGHYLHQTLQRTPKSRFEVKQEIKHGEGFELVSSQGTPLLRLPEHSSQTPQDLNYKAFIFSRYKESGANETSIRPFPPVANIPFDNRSVDKPCAVIRMANFMGAKLPLTGSPLCQWLVQPNTTADGKFYAYGGEMALLYDVIVDPSRRQPGPRGGEKMEEVWGQSAEAEFIKMQKGYFQLDCSEQPKVLFHGKSYLNPWVNYLQCQHTNTANTTHRYSPGVTNVTTNTNTTATTHVTGLTLALQRDEYVNIYFIMLSLYNAFLATLAFNTHPKNITILLVDAHPSASQDDVWTTLFGRMIRAGHLTSPTRFSALGWIPWTHYSPLRQMKAPRVNYLEEFRTFVLRGHQVDTTHTLNCSSLNFLLIWRHDYVAHPRNQNGHIQRKIANEAELLAEVQKVVGPNDKVEGRQLDLDPLQAQLQRVAETDVLVGMHGAGLVHSLFVPRHACVLELYPAKFPHNHEPFRALASWRGLGYRNWKNKDESLERKEGYTYVPVTAVVNLVNTARRLLCE